jgi:tRNA(His) guanylyltransferase
MTADDLEARMKAGECFHALRAPVGTFVVVRVDGRSFSRLTERLVEKPFDVRFHEAMVAAAVGLFETLSGAYAYTESDEISVLLPRASALFDREVEKLVSISASRAAAVVSLKLGEPVEFDGRLWIGAQESDVVDYFRWRQGDCTRAALNGWCYWTLRKEGMSVRDATRKLEGATTADKNELLHARGINFARVPLWQRRGTGIFSEAFEKEGVDPRTGATKKATRRRVAIDQELPMKAAYDRYLLDRIR